MTNELDELNSTLKNQIDVNDQLRRRNADLENDVSDLKGK